MSKQGTNLVNNNRALLEAALEGLELQKARLQEQINEVRRLLGRRSSKTVPAAVPAEENSHKRELSPAARKRIAAAQKRRWAEFRKTKPENGASASDRS